ncbi:hypothetical protein BVI1335_920019 [Burkholderia vietnamiensis]|nr:hypothetical protein BVI1335_920019 [Burkholderia vietnamiensis]
MASGRQHDEAEPRGDAQEPRAIARAVQRAAEPADSRPERDARGPPAGRAAERAAARAERRRMARLLQRAERPAEDHRQHGAQAAIRADGAASREDEAALGAAPRGEGRVGTGAVSRPAVSRPLAGGIAGDAWLRARVSCFISGSVEPAKSERVSVRSGLRARFARPARPAVALLAPRGLRGAHERRNRIVALTSPIDALPVINTSIAATAGSKNPSIEPDCRFPAFAFG